MGTDYDYFKGRDPNFIMRLFEKGTHFILNRQFIRLVSLKNCEPEANEYFKPSVLHESSALYGEEISKELY